MHSLKSRLTRRPVIAATVLALVSLAGPAHAEDPAYGAAAKPAAHTTEADLAVEGKSIYHMHCVHCHGPNMRNAGGAQAYNLKTFPLDQKERFVHSVKKGKNTMPAWSDLINDDEVEALWAYMKTRGE